MSTLLLKETQKERAERLAWHVTQAVDDLKTLLTRSPRIDFSSIEADLEQAVDVLQDALELASFHRRMAELDGKVAEMLGDKYTRLALVEEHAQRIDLRDQLEAIMHAAALEAAYQAATSPSSRLAWLASAAGADAEEHFFDRWN
jgi:hypothetical protein